MEQTFTKKFIIIFIMLLVTVQNSLADNQTKKVNVFKMYRDDILYTTKGIENHPYDLALFGALFGGSILADRGVRSYVEKHQNTTAHNTTDFMNNFGKGYYLFPASAILGLAGYYSKDNKLLSSSFTSMESGITAGLLSVGLKIAAGRERPNATGDPFVFHPFKTTEDKYRSFPSGDVTVSWAMITPYAVYYHEPLLYLLPLGVNFARVYKDKHWLSDTIFGSGLGFAIGYFFSESHLSKNLTFVTNGRKLGIVYRFW